MNLGSIYITQKELKRSNRMHINNSFIFLLRKRSSFLYLIHTENMKRTWKLQFILDPILYVSEHLKNVISLHYLTCLKDKSTQAEDVQRRFIIHNSFFYVSNMSGLDSFIFLKKVYVLWSALPFTQQFNSNVLILLSFWHYPSILKIKADSMLAF